MHRKKVRMTVVCLLIGMILGLFSGCARRQDGPPTLWVVTEKTEWNGMNNQAKQFIKQFQENHPEFEVTLDILPKDKAERSLYLKRIRGQIMAGRGPDVYLLPTSNTFLKPKDFDPPVDFQLPPNTGNDPKKWLIWNVNTDDTDPDYPTEKRVSYELEPLFLDVEQIMQNGLFADISPYYDADETLGKECFQPDIMEAGTFRGGRYILPLRYDFPVLYVDVEGLHKMGLNLEDVDKNILELMDMAIASGDPALACCIEPFFLRLCRGFSLVSEPMNYESDKVAIDHDTLVHFFTQLQALEALIGEKFDHRATRLEGNAWQDWRPVFERGRRGGLTIGGYSWEVFPSTYPMRVSTLLDAPMLKLFGLANDHEYTMLPLRDISNQLTAYVTYWGAVGTGCEHPAEAYEFLRMFLTEDSQFEHNRPFKQKSWYQYTRMDHHLMEDGWPVRVVGSANPIWRITRNPRRDLPNVEGVNYTESDFPPLEAKIDNVYFGCVLEQDFAAMVRSLNDQDTGEPSDVDIDAMADAFLEKLFWHVMEG